MLSEIDRDLSAIHGTRGRDARHAATIIDTRFQPALGFTLSQGTEEELQRGIRDSGTKETAHACMKHINRIGTALARNGVWQCLSLLTEQYQRLARIREETHLWTEHSILQHIAPERPIPTSERILLREMIAVRANVSRILHSGNGSATQQQFHRTIDALHVAFELPEKNGIDLRDKAVAARVQQGWVGTWAAVEQEYRTSYRVQPAGVPWTEPEIQGHVLGRVWEAMEAHDIAMHKRQQKGMPGLTFIARSHQQSSPPEFFPDQPSHCFDIAEKDLERKLREKGRRNRIGHAIANFLHGKNEA